MIAHFTEPGGEPRTHMECEANQLQFIEHGFEFLGILQPNEPVHMSEPRYPYSTQIKSAYASDLDATHWKYAIFC